MGLDIDIVRQISQKNEILTFQPIYSSDFDSAMFWFDNKLNFKDDDFSGIIPNDAIFELKYILQKIENLQNSKKTTALKEAKFAFYQDTSKHNSSKELADLHQLLKTLIVETQLINSLKHSQKTISYIYTRTY